MFHSIPLFLALVSGLPGAPVTYPASDENFPNPERGFYYQASYRPRAGQAPAGLDAGQLRKWRDSGVSLIRMYYVLSEFRDAPLSAALLEKIGADFRAIRESGMKVIPRFAYNFGPIGEPDASLERILQHLDQLAPALRAAADVIAFVEAGFIGTWGEWHHSTNGLLDEPRGTPSHMNESSRAIVRKLLEVLPPGRMIALRYPRHKMDLTGPEPLTAGEAFAETPKARIGAHNDCFLASKNNWGTYTAGIDRERSYYAGDNLFVPQGGETCNVKEDAQPYIGCANSLRELEQLHFNTLNIGYHKGVADGWRAGGCMAEIERRLGYRFRLVDSTAPAVAAPGGEFELKFTIANDGFANLYNARPLEVVLRPKAGGEAIRIATGEDPRRWMPGRNTAVRIAARIPRRCPAGEYELFLSLPDLATSLQGRPEYSIRLANAGIWEPSSGMNRLAHVLTIRRN
jgi:hypothetical protein